MAADIVLGSMKIKMSFSGAGKAARVSKEGQTCTENILYFIMTAFTCSMFVFIFRLVFPEHTFFVPWLGDVYISRELYDAYVTWFNTVAIVIGLLISTILIFFHKRSVNMRIRRVTRMQQG